MKWICAAILGIGLAASCCAQPELPPEERPRRVGVLVSCGEGEGMVLAGGTAAPLAKDFRLVGIDALAELAPGDLVELTLDENGLATEVQVLPRLVERRPLIDLAPREVQLARFWWRHGGQDYPDSLHAADLTVPAPARVSALEAVAAYVAAAGAEPVAFSVLNDSEVALWERRLSPGEVTEVWCPVGQTRSLTFRCRRPGGTSPDYTQCVWGSPTAVLQEPGLLAIEPARVVELVEALSAGLRDTDPGTITVARPSVIGLAPDVAMDLQDDLLVALGARYPVVGKLSLNVPADLALTAAPGAKEQGATAVAAAAVRYVPPQGYQLSAALVDVETLEPLALGEAVQP